MKPSTYLKLVLDWDMIQKDIAEMLDVNIHGYINSRHKSERKPVVSRVGKDCAKKMASGIVAYLKVVVGKVNGE